MNAVISSGGRCPWCLINDKMTKYHDAEWGVPTHDDRRQFEHLMMEVMQCGLNWNMILQKRETLRKCFADFDFDAVASFTDADIARIMAEPNMIRSPRKIAAVIHNAHCFQTVRQEFGSFSDYIWGFTGGRTLIYKSHGDDIRNIPPKNGLSEQIAKDLKKRGFKFLGPITVYSHMQACGMINDHLKSCPRHEFLMRNQEQITCIDDTKI